jgi:hypothetical protein
VFTCEVAAKTSSDRLVHSIHQAECFTSYGSWRNQAWVFEKLPFRPKHAKFGDRKCLGDPRTSLVELPNAILFL